MLAEADKVPVRILRDTGADQSFILESASLFLFLCFVDRDSVVRGMGMGVFVFSFTP